MSTQNIAATEYRNLPLSILTESKTNPRRIFEDAALKELADSIRSQGVLSPLLVRPLNERSFEIVARARRYRAAQMAESETVPVRIVNLTDAEALEAQLIEKLQLSEQEQAIAACFREDWGGGNKSKRILLPVRNLKEWIEHNVMLILNDAPFSKSDATLNPQAGSCHDCPKRTGHNKLLFADVRQDACTDPACYQTKVDAHVAKTIAAKPKLVQISAAYGQPAAGSPAIPRNLTRPDDMAAHCIRHVRKVPQVDPREVEDVVLGMAP